VVSTPQLPQHLESDTDKFYVLNGMQTGEQAQRGRMRGRLCPGHRRCVENNSVSAAFNFVVDQFDRRLQPPTDEQRRAAAAAA